MQPPTCTYTDGLRALADFLDDNPALIPAHTGITSYNFVNEKSEGEPVAEIVQRFRDHAALLGPDANVETQGNYFNATRSFGPHKLQVTLPRDLVTDAPPHPLEQTA